jgi:hypothetical protein
VHRAVAIWRIAPAQIEAELPKYCPGRHIREWHASDFTMSSRELLVLLGSFPDKSRTKGALRGHRYGLPYEWCADEYRTAAFIRQQAPLSASGDMTVTRPLYEAYFSPLERLIMDAQQQADVSAKTKARNHILVGLYAKTKPEGG